MRDLVLLINLMKDAPPPVQAATRLTGSAVAAAKRFNYCDAFVLLVVSAAAAALSFRLHAAGQPLAPASTLTGAAERLTENAIGWLLVYGLSYAVLYTPTELRRRFFTPCKANPQYPSQSVVAQEVGWSALSVIVATGWQLAVDASGEPRPSQESPRAYLTAVADTTCTCTCHKHMPHATCHMSHTDTGVDVEWDMDIHALCSRRLWQRQREGRTRRGR